MSCPTRRPLGLTADSEDRSFKLKMVSQPEHQAYSSDKPVACAFIASADRRQRALQLYAEDSTSEIKHPALAADKAMCCAGGAFDPLGLTADSEDRTFKLKTAEIKHTHD